MHSSFLARSPIARILAYYAVLLVVLSVAFGPLGIGERLPEGRANPTGGGLGDFIPAMADSGGGGAQTRAIEPVAPKFEVGMAIITVIGMLTALVLVIPTAWVYMTTKTRRGYDQSVTHTVFILPIVIAGIVLLVRDSLTLAFSLAGIVAAVRFRNTLKDTKDAVYVFLVIGVGLASGVQAIDVAYVMSLVFSLVVLALWKLNVGGGFRGDEFATPPGSLAVSGPTDGNDKPFTGMLTVRAGDADAVRGHVQDLFEDVSKRWKLLDITEDEGGGTVIEYAVRLKKSADPASIQEDVKVRGGAQVRAVSYRPIDEPAG